MPLVFIYTRCRYTCLNHAFQVNATMGFNLIIFYSFFSQIIPSYDQFEKISRKNKTILFCDSFSILNIARPIKMMQIRT